ncbi:unnamed protein product [Penicillium salamii]|uniref:Uncharacterized protein n=1 Tax=Penicillium salamii TaxID=1612424 RepID=A0A9W4J8M3_9EURO|nr:unnamed protein product [Penicillium salamii]
MSAKTPFSIPEHASSLMDTNRQQTLSQIRGRSVSNSSRLSQISQDSQQSTASDFLDAKIAALSDEQEYMLCVQEGLGEALHSNKIAPEMYEKEIGTVLKSFRRSSQTFQVMKRQRTLLSEDLEDAVEEKRTQEPVENSIVEKAYADTIIPRVMSAAAKIGKTNKFEHKTFRKLIHRFYDVTKKNLEPYVALLLCSKIEGLFDQGIIAIVPIPGAIIQSTTWRCVVLDKSKGEQWIHGSRPESLTKVKDLDNRQLSFLSNARPRRRYLYFRFIISCLNVKQQSLTTSASIQTNRFWRSGGEYFNRLTLKTLARCVSGSENADEFGDHTFEDNDESRNIEAGMILAADLYGKYGWKH